RFSVENGRSFPHPRQPFHSADPKSAVAGFEQAQDKSGGQARFCVEDDPLTILKFRKSIVGACPNDTAAVGVSRFQQAISGIGGKARFFLEGDPLSASQSCQSCGGYPQSAASVCAPGLTQTIYLISGE